MGRSCGEQLRAPNQQQIFLRQPGPATACSARPEDAPVTAISSVQGTTGQSPLVDHQVTVRGTVTASFQDDEQLQGFYVQDAGDADPTTSDGIFVQASSPGVAPGQAVQVTGTVAERFEQTLVGAVEELEVCGDPLTVAATAIILTAESEPELERFEGMLVTFPEPLTVTGSQNLGTFGELVLSDEGRLFNPTDVIDPNEPDNSAVDAAAEANRRRQICSTMAATGATPIHCPSLPRAFHHAPAIPWWASPAFWALASGHIVSTRSSLSCSSATTRVPQALPMLAGRTGSPRSTCSTTSRRWASAVPRPRRSSTGKRPSSSQRLSPSTPTSSA